MKLSSLKQQIEELDAAEVDDKSYWTGEFIQGQRNILFHHHGPELLRRLLVAEEALEYERRLASKQVELLKLRMEEEPNVADSIRPFGSAFWRASERMRSALAAIRGEEE